MLMLGIQTTYPTNFHRKVLPPDRMNLNDNLAKFDIFCQTRYFSHRLWWDFLGIFVNLKVNLEYLVNSGKFIDIPGNLIKLEILSADSGPRLFLDRSILVSYVILNNSNISDIQ